MHLSGLAFRKLCHCCTLHAGFQAAGTFTKAKKHLQIGSAADQMQAIDKQMQGLLEKMQRHNQLIATQHFAIENVDKVHFFHKPAKTPGGNAIIQKPFDWSSKIDFSFFEKVCTYKVLLLI